MEIQNQYIGIDLGTSTSGLAIVHENGHPEIIPNADGERLTPSVVYFDALEKIKVVGSAARDTKDSIRSFAHIKRFMDDPNYAISVDGETWSATEISSLILAKLKRECSQIIGSFRDVVLTVPANFNEFARQSTIAAGKIAGLNVTRLVNEPTAAALYYAYEHGIRGRVLVYDLGGGTLDITLIEINEDLSMRVLTSEGARHLGGARFDEALVDAYSKQYQKIFGQDFLENSQNRTRLLQSTEDAKKMLSKLRQVSDTIGNPEEGMARINLTRDMFESSVSDLLTRTEFLIEQSLNTAKLTPKDIDHVVLVGGSTRIPKVREILQRHFGKEPVACGNVDECVALGAALFAKHQTQVQEVCNHSYGIIALIENIETGTQEMGNSIVIPKNSSIPCSHTQTYQTSENGEQLIEVEITQGEDPNPAYVDIIGKIALEVPPGRAAGCPIHVTYSYDENQRVQTMVTDDQTGKTTAVMIEYRGKGVLSEEEIAHKRAAYRDIIIS